MVISLNNYFYSEMVRGSHGRYTPEQLQRCSQMSGPFKVNVRTLLQAELGVTELYRVGGHHTAKYSEDIPQFIKTYKKEKLFEYRKGRQHANLPNFHADMKHKAPKKLGELLKAYSIELDRWRGINRAERRSDI